jgi:hypothetical protein
MTSSQRDIKGATILQRARTFNVLLRSAVAGSKPLALLPGSTTLGCDTSPGVSLDEYSVCATRATSISGFLSSAESVVVHHRRQVAVRASSSALKDRAILPSSSGTKPLSNSPTSTLSRFIGMRLLSRISAFLRASFRGYYLFVFNSNGPTEDPTPRAAAFDTPTTDTDMDDASEVEDMVLVMETDDSSCSGSSSAMSDSDTGSESEYESACGSIILDDAPDSSLCHSETRNDDGLEEFTIPIQPSFDPDVVDPPLPSIQGGAAHTQPPNTTSQAQFHPTWQPEICTSTYTHSLSDVSSAAEPQPLRPRPKSTTQTTNPYVKSLPYIPPHASCSPLLDVSFLKDRCAEVPIERTFRGLLCDPVINRSLIAAWDDGDYDYDYPFGQLEKKKGKRRGKGKWGQRNGSDGGVEGLPLVTFLTKGKGTMTGFGPDGEYMDSDCDDNSSDAEDDDDSDYYYPPAEETSSDSKEDSPANDPSASYSSEDDDCDSASSHSYDASQMRFSKVRPPQLHRFHPRHRKGNRRSRLRPSNEELEYRYRSWKVERGVEEDRERRHGRLAVMKSEHLMMMRRRRLEDEWDKSCV